MFPEPKPFFVKLIFSKLEAAYLVMLRMTAIVQNTELGNSLLLTFSASERESPTTIPLNMSSSRSRIHAWADQT